ncbi:hypothetical protein GMORB2_0092 [Geosmithia morbida]|uniref:Uncharacterized protein n=1 Tax=Geosmithia morbida TaxID=1094350 RepID=A0A9P4Z2M8_9HYPO|nr:uncharacterized protein GMORB2_0092 [Geosmithia morbida]KAF4126356.1 hypothetical protein GMORB2_0092 [Geosmithia morbida]
MARRPVRIPERFRVLEPLPPPRAHCCQVFPESNVRDAPDDVPSGPPFLNPPSPASKRRTPQLSRVKMIRTRMDSRPTRNLHYVSKTGILSQGSAGDLRAPEKKRKRQPASPPVTRRHYTGTGLRRRTEALVRLSSNHEDEGVDPQIYPPASPRNGSSEPPALPQFDTSIYARPPLPWGPPDGDGASSPVQFNPPTYPRPPFTQGPPDGDGRGCFP